VFRIGGKVERLVKGKGMEVGKEEMDDFQKVLLKTAG